MYFARLLTEKAADIIKHELESSLSVTVVIQSKSELSESGQCFSSSLGKTTRFVAVCWLVR